MEKWLERGDFEKVFSAVGEHSLLSLSGSNQRPDWGIAATCDPRPPRPPAVFIGVVIY